MSRHYVCRSCGHEWLERIPVGLHAATTCRRCGELYLDWTNAADFVPGFVRRPDQVATLRAGRPISPAI